MLKWKALAALVSALISWGTLASEVKTLLDVGLVSNKKKQVIYVEKHLSTMKGDQLVTLKSTYFDLNGKQFAELNSDFTQFPFAPTYKTVDFRFDRFEALSVKDGKLLAEGKSDKDSKVKSKVFEPSETLASGQGLHNFVKLNFQKMLDSKKPLAIDFLIPMNQKSYGFRISHRKDKDTEDTTFFRVEFDSWFFRLIAPNLDVVYRKSDRRLIQFVGPYHLLDQDQNNQSVTIDYHFDEAAKVILAKYSIKD